MLTHPHSLSVLLLVVSYALGGCAATSTSRESTATRGALAIAATSSGKQWTGVAVSRTGRVFVNSPNWHEGHTWSVAEVLKDGTLKAFPDDSTNQWSSSDDPRGKFVCVQSVHVDDEDRLWVLDPGNPQFHGVIPGAAKLVGFDLSQSDRAGWSLTFSDAVAPKDSYLNDIRVDTAREFAYITDSGRGGIVVVNLRSGDAWRCLDGHPSVLAEPIVPVIEDKELRWGGGPNAGQVPQIHADGIALAPDAAYLYYQALTARTLYRVPTSVLRDQGADAAKIAAAVENLGQTVVTDGMIMDKRGVLYFSALEKDAIIARYPDGRLATLVADARIAWPDSFAIGPNDTLYFTTAQIHRSAWFNAEGAMPATPYYVFTHPLAK